MIIQNRSKIKISILKLQKAIDQIFQALAIPHLDFDLHLVEDSEIRKLNKKFRNKDRPTDVLSFPLHSAKEARKGAIFLGDIVISLPTVRRQAKEYQKKFQEELIFLIVHGLLHLLGYDHEKNKREAEVMRRWEKKILNQL